MKNEVIKNKEGQVIKIRSIDYPPSKTQQQFKDECNVNKIIEKYLKTNEMTHLKQNKGVFADLTHISDYQDSLNKVIEANKSFMELNAQTRNRFGNDPQQLINFLADDSNRDEAIKLGLIVEKEKKPVEPPKETPKTPDTKV